MKPKLDYFECICTSSEHAIRLFVDADSKDPYFGLTVYLAPTPGFGTRLANALGYVFRSANSCGFDETLLDKAQVEKLRNCCNKFLETPSGV